MKFNFSSGFNFKCIATGLVCLSSLLGFSQEVNVYWGKENPMDHRGAIHLLGRRGNLLFGYRESGRTLSLMKYSAQDLQIKGETVLIGKSDNGSNVIDRDYTFNDFLTMKNKTLISVSKYDRKADINSIYVQAISDEGKLTGKLQKVADISAKSRRNSGSFMVFSSQDSSKFLIVNNPPFEKYAGEKFGFKVYDENLKKISDLEVALPYKDKNFSAENFILGNDGVIYLLASIELEKGQRVKGESNYYYEIVTITPTGKGQVSEFEIKLPNKTINDVSYSLDEKKGLICAGFYGDIKQKGRANHDINGIFYLRINKDTKELEASGTKELDKDFIADLTSQRKANKGGGISSDFTIKNLITKNDGGSILLAEYSYDYVVVTQHSDPKTGAVTTTTTYHYVRNNIIAVNINPDGSIKWYVNIPKFQHTVNDMGEYSSFMLETKGSKMYMVYNDNSSNMQPDKTGKLRESKDLRTMTSPGRSTAVLVVLDDAGNFEKKMLMSNKENKITLMPSKYINVSPDETVTFALNAGIYCCLIPLKPAKYKLARFEFK